MDDFDRAQELEMIARTRAIETQQRRFAELKTAPRCTNRA